jgi:hypothetical protein
MSAPRTTPTLGLGLAIAFVLALCGASVLAALTPFVGAGTALRAVVALLGFTYLLYVLGKSGERAGRVTTVVVWAAAAALTWISGVPLVGYVLIHVGLLWLVRSLYFYSGILPAIVDLGLSLLAIAFAVWAAGRSGSALLAFWCFFLVHAFHVLIPSALFGDGKQRAGDEDVAFNRAHRAAEAAVRRMSASR